MGLQNIPGYIGVQSDGVTPTNHPVELDRMLLGYNVPQAGIVDANNGVPFGTSPSLIAPGSSNLQLAVAPFKAALKGSASGQGYYGAYSDVGDTVAINAPSANNRIDTLLCCVGDPEYGTVASARWGAKYAWATGSPGSSPVALTDAQISSTSVVPGAWLPLADVLIQPADSSRIIPAGSLTRRWPWAYAMGKNKRNVFPTGASFSNTTSTATIDTFTDWGFPPNASMSIKANINFGAVSGVTVVYTLSVLFNGSAWETVNIVTPPYPTTSNMFSFETKIPLSSTSYTYKAPATFAVTVKCAAVTSGTNFGSWNSAVINYEAKAEALS